ARVIGYRTVGVCGQSDAQGGEHANGGNPDAVEAHAETFSIKGPALCRKTIGKHRSDRHESHWGQHRDHTFTHTGNDDGRRTGLRLLRDSLRGAIAMRSIVLGRLADQDTGYKSCHDRTPQAPVILEAQAPENEP